MKRKILPLVMSLLLPLSASQNTYAIPDLGSPSSGSLSATKEEELGKLFLDMVRKQVHIIEDPILHDYVNNFGHNLVAHSNAKSKQFDFFIVDSEEINAFAGPAAHIGVNRGTLLLAQSEHELAAVLGHEISHVSQHHLARAMEQSTGNTLMSLAGIAAAILVGSVAGNNAGIGGFMAAQTLSVENQLGYSRSNEHEADRIGLQVMYNSGFDPNAMPIFLSRMAKNNIDLLDGRFSYLRTHPITEERIADIKSRVDHFPHREYTHSATFPLMQTRLDVISGDYRPSKLSFYKNHQSKNHPIEAQEYGYGLMLLRAGYPKLAEQTFSKLRAQNSQEILFLLAHSDALVMLHRLPEATLLLQQAYALNPNYSPLIQNYAQLLLQQKQAHHAKKVLMHYLAHHHNHIPSLMLLAQAQAANGQLSQAYVTRAKIYKITGQDKHAKMQYQQAFKFARPNDKQFIETEMKQ